MPTPEFVLSLREKIGHAPLWLSGCKAVVLRDAPGGDAAGGGVAGGEVEGGGAPGRAVQGEAPAREILLARRSDNGSWSVPAGIIEPGEEPADTAVREVLEECGVHARPVRLAGVGTTPEVHYPNGDQAQYLDVVMVLEYVSGQARVADDENLEVAWFPLTVEGLPPMPEGHRRAVRWAVAAGPAAQFLADGVERAADRVERTR